MNLIIEIEDMEESPKMRNKELVPNELSKETKASMKTRIISAIVGAIIIIPVIFLGDFFIFGVMGFILLVSTYEIIHCAKRKYNVALYIVAFILALLMTYWPIIRSMPDCFKTAGYDWSSWRVFNAFNEIYISLSVLALSAFGLFVMVLIDKGFTVRDACFIFTMMLIITVGYQSILYIRYLPSSAYHQVNHVESYFNMYDNLESCLLLVYVLLGTFMTDIGAYFVGVFFGKHKMLERISPKKTWEGFFGGVIISTIVSFGFGMAFCLTGHPLVLGILDKEHWYFILGLSLLIPLASVLGDFVFSACKRHFDIKDFGNIIPGHGGMLDRLDSVIFSMITTAVFLELIQYWSGIIQ